MSCSRALPAPRTGKGAFEVVHALSLCVSGVSDWALWPTAACPGSALGLFFPEEAKVGIAPVRAIIERMRDEELTDAIVVIRGGMTPSAKKVRFARAAKEQSPQHPLTSSSRRG